MRIKETDVRICTGTACFVMGGADLLLLAEELAERWGPRGITREMIEDRIHISGSPCIGHCRESGLRPPFLTIDGQLIGEATLEGVLAYLDASCLDQTV
jgi:NADH:ubiquinone oxidoreductase subunit E